MLVSMLGGPGGYDQAAAISAICLKLIPAKCSEGIYQGTERE